MKIINKLASYINSLKNKFINQEKKKISYKDISISSLENEIHRENYKHSFSNSVTTKEFALLFLATLAQTRRETTGLVPFPQTYLGDIDELFLSKNDSYYSRFLDLSKLKEKDKTKAIDEFLIKLEKEIENILGRKMSSKETDCGFSEVR